MATEVKSAAWWRREVRPWWARLVVGRRPWVTLVRLAIVAALCWWVFREVLVPIRVTGRSMEPTYRSGRITFVNRMAYRTASPQRGDVVGIRKEGTLLVILKRLVALPGEQVAVRAGRVLVNGDILEEPYAVGQGIPSTRGIRVLGSDEYFAIGDNRELTAYDVVRRGEIEGKVFR